MKLIVEMKGKSRVAPREMLGSAASSFYHDVSLWWLMFRILSLFVGMLQGMLTRAGRRLLRGLKVRLAV